MAMNRRALLGAVSVGVAASATSVVAQAQQAPPAQQAQPTLQERIATRALENRHRLAFDGARFSGPAYDILLREGREATFFLIGEEHGIAENPQLAAQLFGDLRSSGYSKVAIETSPPMAAALDSAARGGMDGLRPLLSDPASFPAFFTMREEAEWLAAARAAAPGRAQVLWGFDYDIGADRRWVAVLKRKRKPAAAAAALAALEAAQNESWARYAETRGPQHIFMFSGDPALVTAVRQAWPRPDAEAQIILETLEETLFINREFVQQRGYSSNQRRAAFNKRNFRRYWDAEEDKPRVMFKFGASHMVRGLSHTLNFDIGTQAAELAEANGGKSYHLMVMPGPTSPHAQMDPTAMTYRPAEGGTYAQMGLEPLMNAAFPDAMTLIDLRPIRPLAYGPRHKTLDSDFVRTVHGFDALLIMTGSTASSNL